MENIRLVNAEKIEQIEKILLDNKEATLEICKELNSWNGDLENFNVMENEEEFFDMYFEGKPAEAVRAAYYGNYNYMDEYVRFNGYGNLESLNQWKLEQEIEFYINDIIDSLLRNYNNIYIDNENLLELLESIN